MDPAAVLGLVVTTIFLLVFVIGIIFVVRGRRISPTGL